MYTKTFYVVQQTNILRSSFGAYWIHMNSFFLFFYNIIIWWLYSVPPKCVCPLGAKSLQCECGVSTTYPPESVAGYLFLLCNRVVRYVHCCKYIYIFNMYNNGEPNFLVLFFQSNMKHMCNVCVLQQ